VLNYHNFVIIKFKNFIKKTNYDDASWQSSRLDFGLICAQVGFLLFIVSFHYTESYYLEFGNDLRVGSHSSVVQGSILLGCDSPRNTASHHTRLESSYIDIFTGKN